MKKEKTYKAIFVDEPTHKKIKVESAKQEVSIGEYIKLLVK